KFITSVFNRFVKQCAKPSDFPMLRYFPQPLDAGVLHWRIRFEALSDRMGDDSPPLLLEQFDQPLLLLHERIDLGRLAVEECGNRRLLELRRHRNSKQVD